MRTPEREREKGEKVDSQVDREREGGKETGREIETETERGRGGRKRRMLPCLRAGLHQHPLFTSSFKLFISCFSLSRVSKAKQATF